MDPLSEVLSMLKPVSHGFRGLDAGPSWALSFPAWEGLKCYAVAQGHCFLWVDGLDDPIAMAEGELVMLPRGQGYRLGSGQGAPCLDAETFFSSVPWGDVAIIDGGGRCAGVGGYFEFDNRQAERLLGVLPAVIHLRGTLETEALRTSIERLMRELRDPQPGGDLIADHLAQTLLIEALRLHLRSSSEGRPGWLSALADRQMNIALSAMHADPARRWTLEALARLTGMSRSSFAARFTGLVGEPAMAYLTRWRMTLAADRIATGTMPISAIAHDLGYESESAFGTAFKRVMGCSPRAFGKVAEEARTPSASTPVRSKGR